MRSNDTDTDHVLEFIDDVTVGVNSTQVDITTACDRLAQTAPAVTVRAATTSAANSVSEYHAELERISKSGSGNIHSAARTARIFLGTKVITAVCHASVPPELNEAITTADADVASAEQALTGTLERLKNAVAEEDLDAIITLRPQVEVTLPGRVDQANLTASDARLAVSQVVHTAAARYRAAAARRASTGTASGDTVIAAESALDSAAGAARASRQRRDELATQCDAHRQRRLRELAGLAEPNPGPQTSQPEERPLTFGKGPRARDPYAVQRERDAEFKRSQQRAAGFASERREGARR